MRPLYAFFPPLFFAFIGIELDLGALIDGHALWLLAAITALAALTKRVPAYLAARRELGRTEAAIVGIGMVPRGKVGIVVASIGRRGRRRRRAVRGGGRDGGADDARGPLWAAATQRGWVELMPLCGNNSTQQPTLD